MSATKGKMPSPVANHHGDSVGDGERSIAGKPQRQESIGSCLVGRRFVNRGWNCFVIKESFSTRFLLILVKVFDSFGRNCGFVYDSEMEKHCCAWDPIHIENPRRVRCIHTRLRQLISKKTIIIFNSTAFANLTGFFDETVWKFLLFEALN